MTAPLIMEPVPAVEPRKDDALKVILESAHKAYREKRDLVIENADLQMLIAVMRQTLKEARLEQLLDDLESELDDLETQLHRCERLRDDLARELQGKGGEQ